MRPRPETTRLDPAIGGLLDLLRRRIRRYVWLEGLGWAAAWLAAAFWATLAIDRFFEPSPGPRRGLVAVVLAGLAWIIYRHIVRRLIVPLRDRNMALLVERYFPQFRDSLLTTVELADAGLHPGYNPAMLEQTRRMAAQPLGEVRLKRVFNPAPLRWSLGAGAAAGLSVLVFMIAAWGAFETWANRVLFASPQLWPRRAYLVVPGFTDGSVKVTKGSSFTVQAEVDLHRALVPETVYVRLRSEGASREPIPMQQIGVADPQEEQYQAHAYKFSSLLTPVEFDVIGGDYTVSGLRIEVVDVPKIVQVQLACTYPPYMLRKPETVALHGATPLPIGSQITLRAKTNKDLVRVEVSNQGAGEAAAPQIIRPPEDRPREFEIPLGTLTADRVLGITLHDADGFASPEAESITLVALEDRPPTLSVQLSGIGTAITPAALLPFSGKAGDDNGLARIWLEYVAGSEHTDTKPSQVAVAAPAGNLLERSFQASLDVRQLRLQPDQKLIVCLKAQDRFNLGAPPQANVGTSDHWELKIVTEARLLALLKIRELGLRRQLEAVSQELVNRRESLGRIEFAAAAPGAVPPKPPEPGQPPDENSAEARLARAASSVQAALQAVRDSTQECLKLADSFAEIHAELVNNRVDNPKEKLRVQKAIIAPLRELGGVSAADAGPRDPGARASLPNLERSLEDLQAVLADPAAGPRNRAAALRQADAVIDAIQQILKQMAAMEDYNKLISLLQAIIDAEKKIEADTRQRHTDSLRDLEK